LEEFWAAMNKINHLINLIKAYFAPFLSISFGMFLFILFFQPIPFETFDFNNRLIFIGGLGLIIFLTMLIIKILFFIIVNEEESNVFRPVIPTFLSGFAVLVISSVAFAFYIRYIGDVRISFFIMIRIILICLVPPVVIRVYDIIRMLRQHNDMLIKEKKSIQKQVEKFEEDYLNKTISINSETGTDYLNLPVADVAFIRSADNYVEIVYREGDVFRKKLIRNTLKGIEKQIKDYSNFIRCHRICIVNSHFIEKFTRNYSSYWIVVKGLDEKIPVSRQYLLKIKEVV
jgi:DNA-binding LytR/AlgR family response regulator